MERVIGTDLGTYNSAAVMAFSKDELIPIQSKNGRSFCEKNHPSFVQFDKTGKKICVGGLAKNLAGLNPELVVWGAKRLVGISYNEAVKNEELKRFKYPISKDENGNILIQIGKTTYRPQDILQFILEEIKADAENPDINPMTGGAPIESIVITVPAYFNAFRTQPIIDAAKAAGFKRVETIAEPTAAAIRYGLQVQKESLVLSFDIGAGTLDISLLQVLKCGDKFEPAELVHTGDNAFGGIDIDSLLVSHLTNQFQVGSDPKTQSMFRMEVEKTKIRLSTAAKAILELPDLRTVEMTRQELEEILMKPDPETNQPYLLSKLRTPIQEVFNKANRSASEVDHVLFIGGPVKMPMIRRIVREELAKLGLRKEVLHEIDSLDQKFPIDPMDAVSEGASIVAAGIQKPVTTVLAEGYGTIQGLDYYAPITEPNSDYPIQGKVSLVCGNGSKRLPIPLVLKLPDSRSMNAYKYMYLGQFNLAIRPTGQPPLIHIDMTIHQDKSVSIQLTHQQTSQKTIYHALDKLVGEEIQLREGELDPEIVEMMKREFPNSVPTRDWNQEELDRIINAARSIVMDNTQNSGPAKEAFLHLKNALNTAIQEHSPSKNGPEVYNSSQTFLSLLMAHNIIDPTTYLQMKTELDAIVEA